MRIDLNADLGEGVTDDEGCWRWSPAPTSPAGSTQATRGRCVGCASRLPSEAWWSVPRCPIAAGRTSVASTWRSPPTCSRSGWPSRSGCSAGSRRRAASRSPISSPTARCTTGSPGAVETAVAVREALAEAGYDVCSWW